MTPFSPTACQAGFFSILEVENFHQQPKTTTTAKKEARGVCAKGDLLDVQVEHIVERALGASFPMQ